MSAFGLIIKKKKKRTKNKRNNNTKRARRPFNYVDTVQYERGARVGVYTLTMKIIVFRKFCERLFFGTNN